MALLDLLGRSWAMGALWQLAQGGPATFRALQDRCEGVSPTVLNTRLKELTAAQLIERTGNGYALTALGDELYRHLAPLKPWAHRWADQISAQG